MVRIPSGATNIDVRQHSYSGKPEDDNYLGKAQTHDQNTFRVLLAVEFETLAGGFDLSLSVMSKFSMPKIQRCQQALSILLSRYVMSCCRC